ncbi:uncharacterized protein LOC132301528 isoform X3 [Cornus florida]|uniref:uncharacterized protein LOC132301528 isoform X3 n=1 Tax=Cornus florida TaxID=4283 RepID=UPI00289C6C0B|nr:uncharacterized protein LOC132301528 isoform X3 [Cornus florida]
MEEHEEPSSPGLSPVQLKECIEEVLNFTLASLIDETLGFDIGLSKEYCSNLLKNDPANPNCNHTDFSGGVSQYPLRKPLASALYQSISSGTLIHEDSSMKQKEEKWNQLVLAKGSELVNMLKTIDFEFHVQEPFFSQLKDGLKTTEGRCAVGDYNKIGSGALLLFNKCFVLQVQDVIRYASFSEMLEAESLAKVLPGVKTTEEGVQIYRKFYTEEKERSNGVLAIRVTKPAAQLYIPLASILLGLSYEGVQRLLGLTRTAGTIPEALPPPRSTLLLSFLLPHNPEVKGSILTDGARALAKHINRSSDGYWGSFNGSDSDKNRLAVDVITRLIDHCCWQNMHIVPPHGVVFEIRIADGYGARWSEDGTKDLRPEES